MDFLDSPQAWESDFESRESPQEEYMVGDEHSSRIAGAISQTIVQAIRDATQTVDAARQQEAASWLMICCPDIAEQVNLPDVNFERMPTLAAAYVMTEGSTLA